MDISKTKVCVTSTAIVLGCAGVAYYLLRKKLKVRDATDALSYLTIKIVSDETECDEVVEELRK